MQIVATIIFWLCAFTVLFLVLGKRKSETPRTALALSASAVLTAALALIFWVL